MPRRSRHREPDDLERDLGPPADPASVARTLVLAKLTASAKSRAELAEALASRGVPDDVSGRVLDRFEEVGLVDDAAFAGDWVRSRAASRGLSRRALGHELRRKGVADEVIRAALESVDTAEEVEIARDLARRRVARLRGLDSAVQARRLLGLLARKGYSSGLATRVVREVLAEAATESRTPLASSR